jgi:hypothetical protein
MESVKRRSAGIRRVFLLAILAWAASPGRVPAYETLIPSDLAVVPQDATVVFSVRCAAVADKIGFDADPGALEGVAQACLTLGLRGADVERVTVVFHTTWPEPVLIVRTVKPVVQRRILGALAPQCMDVTSHGKQWLASKAGDTGIYFADAQTFVVGSKDSIPHCLDPKKHEKPAPFADFLADAVRHDAVAWSAAVPHSELPAPRRNCCYRYPAAQPPTAEFVVSHKRPCNSPAPATRKNSKALFLIPITLPETIESASATLDLGEEMVVEGRLTCSDPAGAEKSEKLVQLGVDTVRMMALMAGLELAGAELEKELAAAPPAASGLIRQAEKALQATRIRRDGKTLSVTAKLPADGKKLGAALRGLGELLADEGCCKDGRCGAGCMIGSGTGAAAGALIGNGTWRAAVPCSPSTPVTAGVAPGVAVGIGSTTPPYAVAPGMPSSSRDMVPGIPASAGRIPEPLPLPPTPPTQVIPSYPGGPIGIYTNTPPQMIAPVGQPTPTPSSPVSVGSSPQPVSSIGPSTPTAPPAPIAKFTVANVKKEPALLFTEGEGGKLTFVRRVPTGEAVDLESTAGARWIAVFSDKPAGTAFSVGKPGEVVLLR